MKPEKLEKIKAVLADPASTENEKEICRKLLAKHKPDDPVPVFDPLRNPDNQTLEDLWNSRNQSPFYSSQANARAQAAQQNSQSGLGDIFTGLFGGGVGSIFGRTASEAAGFAPPELQVLKHCMKCGNSFFTKTGKDIYCDICLKAKRRAAE